MADGLDEAEAIRRTFVARDTRPKRPWVEAASRILTAERWARTRELVRSEISNTQYPPILDVGCGGGLDIEFWHNSGWPVDQLAGIDLVETRVKAARQRNPDVDIRVGTGVSLPFADDAFTVATAATVFSSILSPTARSALFGEMERIVRPDGLIVIYDFVIRNPRNPRVVAMSSGRLMELAGRSPTGSFPLSALLHVVGPAALIHPRFGQAVARVAPRTHRISFWRARPTG